MYVWVCHASMYVYVYLLYGCYTILVYIVCVCILYNKCKGMEQYSVAGYGSIIKYWYVYVYAIVITYPFTIV